MSWYTGEAIEQEEFGDEDDDEDDEEDDEDDDDEDDEDDEDEVGAGSQLRLLCVARPLCEDLLCWPQCCWAACAHSRSVWLL